ncbi:hypothetical protein KP509_1Z252000 [Ceratopteris richardii]|nr:hypothetical protein KP509_1Z252000 [Ceratopteris richardii]
MQQAADWAKEYTDRKRSPRSSEEGYGVFHHCTKLSPRFCGPWKIVKKLNEGAYLLKLPPDCRVHVVFHVSKLRKYISREDNLIEGIVSLQESKSTNHSPSMILDRRHKRLRNPVIQENLVAWRGLPLTECTWE